MQTNRPDPRPHDDGVDRDLEILARASRAGSFGPGFEDRVLARVADARRDARVPGGWASPRIHRLVPSASLRFAAVAATLAVLVVTGWLADGLRWRSVVAPAGRSVPVILTDGSSVTLHPASTLRYRPFRLRSERRVTLKGEAFLEVAPDGRPFVVRTFNAEVVVTGTRFNVRAWPDDESRETAVALVEGSVLLQPLPGPVATAADAGLRLGAGESGRVGPGGAPEPGFEAPSDATLWTTGGLSFRDRPLADVLRALERRYGVPIEADPSVTEGRTATYLNPETPELVDVLDALSFALGLRYARTAEGWLLVPSPTPAAPTS